MTKTAVIHQPDFIPYLGFFQRLLHCDLFIVLSGASTSGGLRFGMGSVPTLTLGDAEALARLPTLKG
ncbi:MAG: WbqC family protein, partial [Nitrospirales bacterium]|nr:WbqC family protein [Nitrospirales bacterium]